MNRQCSSCGGFCKKSGCERANTPNRKVGLTDQNQEEEHVNIEKVRVRIMQEAYDLADRNDVEGYNAIKTMCNDVLALLSRREWVGLTDEEIIKHFHTNVGTDMSSDQPQTTHSDQCWRWHHECAIAKIERGLKNEI